MHVFGRRNWRSFAGDSVSIFRTRAPQRLDDLARIHDVERIERPFDRAHRVERRLAVLGQQIFHLALADAVLAGAGAVHGQRALDQPFEKRLRRVNLVFVVQCPPSARRGNCRRRHGRRSARRSLLAAMSRCVAATHSASREIGTQTSVANAWRAGPQARAAPNRRHGAPATAACGPRPASPNRTGRRRNSAAISPKRCDLLGDARLGAVEFEKQHRRLRQARALNRRSTRAPARRREARCARPECRTGWSGSWRCTPPRPTETGRCRTAIASGMPASRRVSSVMTPSVPSEPTIRRVRS